MTNKYFFLNDPTDADSIFGDQQPTCLDEAEIRRLSAEWERDLFEIMHEASDDEIAQWGTYNTTDEEPEENVEPLRLQFEATPDGNALSGENDSLFIRCTIEVPEGASEDYGYLTMKEAILAELTDEEKEAVSFWYDGHEQGLEEDASADADVDLYIERF